MGRRAAAAASARGLLRSVSVSNAGVDGLEGRYAGKDDCGGELGAGPYDDVAYVPCHQSV